MVDGEMGESCSEPEREEEEPETKTDEGRNGRKNKRK